MEVYSWYSLSIINTLVMCIDRISEPFLNSIVVIRSGLNLH